MTSLVYLLMGDENSSLMGDSIFSIDLNVLNGFDLLYFLAFNLYSNTSYFYLDYS